MEAESPAVTHTCSKCRRDLPPDKFIMRTERQKKCGRIYEYKRRTYDCRDCRAKKKRDARRESGSVSLAEFKALRAAAKARSVEARRLEIGERAAARVAARAARPRLSPEQRLKRVVDRQRERYRTDPDYQAQVHAKKIRRKRAMKGTQVVPVNRERVAERDGWRCGICGGKVTRENWSLDHVVPLSKGGSHTYRNVVLAHLNCNVKRGVGKLAVQAPLFARP